MSTAANQWNKAEVHACLDGMLASPLFAQAERQKQLLRYLVSATLAGRPELLKGYTIGLEVFDRAPDFDPAIDAIVRVQAAQLRAKLREYYEGEGGKDPIRFELPKGGYTVRIVPREQQSSALLVATAPSQAHAGIEPSVGPPPIKDKPSLVVLPFLNWSSDPDQEYFADGITEDLTTELSKLSGLFVISRHSAFVYKGVAKRADEIGTELGVGYLLEGSVRRSGGQLRISAQLIEAASGAHIWAERYDRELQDIFAVQDDVTRQIVGVLQVKLSPHEWNYLGYEGASSVEAHDLLLQARERFFCYTRESSAEARTLYGQALKIDPNYAAAHARLAQTYVRDWAFDWEQDLAVLETALAHACKAVEIDQRLPLAHAILGWVQLWRKQGEDALAACRRGVELDPNNADARLFLSLTLTCLNRGDEALAEITTGMRLNPYPSAHYLLVLGMCHYVLRNYDLAIAAFERGVALTPAFTPNWRSLIVLYALAGRKEDSMRARGKLLQLIGDSRGYFPASMFLDDELIRRYERDKEHAWSL